LPAKANAFDRNGYFWTCSVRAMVWLPPLELMEMLAV